MIEVEAVIPKKFCTSCQCMRPQNEGQIKKTTASRWICNVCVARKSASVYSSKGKDKHDYKRNVAGFATRDYE